MIVYVLLGLVLLFKVVGRVAIAVLAFGSLGKLVSLDFSSFTHMGLGSIGGLILILIGSGVVSVMLIVCSATRLYRAAKGTDRKPVVLAAVALGVSILGIFVLDTICAIAASILLILCEKSLGGGTSGGNSYVEF